MRITKISITGLFGRYHYNILLNIKERITIIHAPNGKGKTTFLQLIDAALSEKPFVLYRTPFKKLIIHFDDGNRFEVEKIPKKRHTTLTDDTPDSELVYTLYNEKGKPKKHRDKGFDIPLQEIEEILPFLKRIDANAWVDKRNGTILNLYDINDRHSDQLPNSGTPTPPWLKEFNRSVSSMFIGANRLFVAETRYHREWSGGSFIDRHHVTPAVIDYATRLRKEINRTRAKAADSAQRLDRSFPSRIIKQLDDKKAAPGEKEVRQAIEALEKRRQHLMSVGLIDEDLETPSMPKRIYDKEARRVLALYAEDSQEKLARFDDLERRMACLREIINSRLVNKKMLISRQKGMSFLLNNGTELRPEQLSSGEQHEIVLAYSILFNAAPGSLILLDEPELSLHIAWQHELIEDLQKMAQLNNVDVIVATHSPQIVNGLWDLTAELKDDDEETIS